MTTAQSTRRERFRLSWRRLVLAGLVLAVLSATLSWYWAHPPRLPILATLDLPGRENWPLAFSPDGKTLAAWGPGGVSFWDLAGQRVRANATLPTWAFPAVFSPDGSTLAAHLLSPNEGKVAVIDTGDGSVRTTLSMTHPHLGGQRFSPDGTHFSIVSFALFQPNVTGQVSNWVLQTWRTSDWVEEPSRALSRVPDYPFTLGPNWTSVAVNPRGTSTLSLRGLAGESPVEWTLSDVTPPPSGFRELFFSCDGRTLAVARNDGVLDLWDLDEGTKTLSLPTAKTGYEFWSVTFTPDGNVFTPDGKTLITTETETLASRGPPGRIDNVLKHAFRGLRSWQPSPYVAVRDPASGRPRAILDGSFRPVVSADGSVLATADVDGRLILWDLTRSPKPAPGQHSP